MITVLKILTFEISRIFLWKFNLWKPHTRHRVNNEWELKLFMVLMKTNLIWKWAVTYSNLLVFRQSSFQLLHAEVPKRLQVVEPPCMVQNNTGACKIDLINRDKIFPSNLVKESKLSMYNHSTWDVSVSNENIIKL